MFFNEAVEMDQELAHDGDECDFVGFAGGSQALINGFQDGIGAGGAKGGFGFTGGGGGGSGTGPTSTPIATPEPGSFAMLAGGLLMLAGLARRRRERNAA